MNNTLVRTLACGFIAGAVSFLIFHQGGFFIAKQLGLTTGTQWSMAATKPWGVPQLVSYLFWTGLWGALAAFLVPYTKLPAMLGWVLFGAVVVIAANWFIVLPLKGAPIGGGFRMPGVAVAPVVYGFWGLGMWLVYRALRKPLGASAAPVG
jgi:hypothetical protein